MDPLTQSLNTFWWQAVALCCEMDEFQPDVLVALLHSGWLPVRAAQVLWEETRNKPFPPTARTNIGREKQRTYDAWSNAQLVGNMYNGEYGDPVDIGFFLYWLRDQRRWQDELREQIIAARATAEAPRRILIFDDFCHMGDTSTIALTLLRHAFPSAQRCFLYGEQTPASTLASCWLEEYQPQAHRLVLRARKEVTPKGSWAQPFIWIAGDVACGTEDLDRDSLLWQPISAQSQAVQDLVAISSLSTEEWLGLPRWTLQQVESHIHTTAHAKPEAALRPEKLLYHQTIQPAWLICEYVWENGWARIPELAVAAGIDEVDVARTLEWLVKGDSLVCDGDLYMLPRQAPGEYPWPDPPDSEMGATDSDQAL